MTRQAQRQYRAAASRVENAPSSVVSCDDPDCPLGHLRNAFIRQMAAEAGVEKYAREAYAAGHSWTAIGAMVGISKQAARKRFGDNDDG